MALLLDNQTTPVEGSAVEFTSPATIYVNGLAGGRLRIEISPDVSPLEWSPVKDGRVYDSAFTVEPIGTYHLRAVLDGVKPNTNCTVHAIDG